jgi:transcriptional regulator
MNAGSRESARNLYALAAFRETRKGALFAHAARHPFATLVTHGAGGVLASELPLLVDEGKGEGGQGGEEQGEGQNETVSQGVLRGHVARENPQLAHLEAGAEALAIFHGPHGYVSPSVYEGQRGVPTWNYVVVHARGRARVLDEQGLVEVLVASAERFDETGWRLAFGDTWPEVPRPMLVGIAGFEIRVESLEGKWKLSQNRTPEDQARVAEWLERGDAASQAAAALMRARL